jgi:cysteine synthase A
MVFNSQNDDLKSRVNALAASMRETPLIQIPFDEAEVHAKLEYCNMVGSVKDRPALWILRAAIERGEIDRHTTVVESSSGNFAVALAAFSRWLGLRFVPVIDLNTAPINEAVLRATCDQVIRVEKRDDTGGFLKNRLAEVERLRSGGDRCFWTNQYGNPDCAAAHYHWTAGEICDRFTQLDYAFIGVSSAGTIAGLSRRLKERFPRVHIVAVDAEGSIIFGGPAKKRTIPGIGSSIVPPLLQQAQIDEVMLVSEADTVRACRELFRRGRVLAGGSSGSAFAAISRYPFRARAGGARPRVVFLCADRGTAYLDTVYNDEWVRRLGVVSPVEPCTEAA